MQIAHTRASKGFGIPKSGRFAKQIRPYEKGSIVDIGLLGVPSDLGVKHAGGRPGAALGPDAIRDVLSNYGTRYNAERDIDLSTLNIADFGNLICDENSLENTHKKLSKAVAQIVGLGAIPLIFGGSHDLSFAALRGLAEVKKGPFGGITLDAHFDVRAIKNGLITSGTPFWNMFENIDEIQGEHFVEIGINGLINAQEHFEYLSKKQSRIFFLNEVRDLGMKKVMGKALQIATHQTKYLFLSIDLDAIAEAYAPGVSAPSPEGLKPEEAASAAYLAGRHKKTAYFDLMELNPLFDGDGKTARLAAALVLHFCYGVAQRKTVSEKVIGFRSGKK